MTIGTIPQIDREQLVPARADAVAASLRSTYAAHGWRAFWERDLALAKNQIRNAEPLWLATYDRYCSPYWLAWRYARLGDHEAADAQLELAFTDREHHITEIGLEPNFKDLRSDPRFQSLRRRVGLDATDAKARLVE